MEGGGGKGREVYAGLDLSESADLTALGHDQQDLVMPSELAASSARAQPGGGLELVP